VAWETALQRGVRQWLPRDARRFYIGFLPVEDRTLQRTGVQLENIRYWSDTLPTIARHKEPITVRYDPRNMSRIYVRGPRSTDYIDVPYADIRYPPVSLYEIKAARDVLRAQGKKRIQQHEIFQAIEAQRKVINEARAKTREVRRSHARRPGAGSPIQGPSMPPAGEVNYNVEPITYPVEILTDTP
jgi:putative transposase